jgi:hypothetical protein
VHSEASRETDQSKIARGQAHRIFMLVCVIVLLGLAAYLVVENIGKQSVDRNVPGATTGPGMKSLADE